MKFYQKMKYFIYFSFFSYCSFFIITMNFFMNKISQLISLLGGTGAVAEKLKIKPSAISNWKKLNKIPSTKHKDVLKLGSNLDVNIEHFLPTQKLYNFKFKILLIISGGIASYKSLEIIRLIKKLILNLMFND